MEYKFDKQSLEILEHDRREYQYYGEMDRMYSVQAWLIKYQ